MKLRCFTSLIATMLIANTAGAVEVYNNKGNVLSISGNISVGQYFSKNDINSGSSSFIRYGITSRSEINDKFFGFGTWESEVDLQNIEECFNVKDSMCSLLGFAGVNFGEFGSIDYGRNYGVLYDVSSWTDIIPEFGSNLSIPDNFLSNRASNLITYRNTNCFGFVNGLNFAIQYQAKNDIDEYTGRTVKTANGEGYGVSASYNIGNGLGASIAYANSKRLSSQKNLDGTYTSDNAVSYLCGLKYDAYGMYLAAAYGENYNMTPFGDFNDQINSENICGFINRSKNFEIVAKYLFDFGFNPSVSYMHSKASDVENGYSNDLKKYVTLGTGFMFNKNVFTRVDYRFNLLSKNDFITSAKISTDDLFAFGLSYIF